MSARTGLKVDYLKTLSLEEFVAMTDAVTP